ncbi:MAG: hypothetical protein K8H88_25135 [Sandaracinaceae bacterium]|nr:hypothetical protein [Sandaracinaceae bacterium]
MEDPILRAARAAADHYESIRELPVTGPARPAELESYLRARYTFDASLDPSEVVDDLVALLRRGSVHVTHPAYLGMFNPSVLCSSIAASTLLAAFDPQAATWSHAAAAVAIEQHVLRFLMSRIGYDPGASAAHFTSGGQEANTEALAAALAHAFPAARDAGLRTLPGDPVLYASAEAHHSLEKAARMAGLGTGAVRRVGSSLRMDAASLAGRIAADRAQSKLPFMVVATVGATASGAIDPLEPIADLCAREGLWMHADAAWGGAVVLSTRARAHAAGLERADSITWDAHKWLQVPLGTGMLFTRRPEALRAAFAVESPYMPAGHPERPDPYSVSHQWSRRPAGVALFAALAELGAQGYERLIDRMVELGGALRERLIASQYVIVNETPLPLVCFTHPRIESGAVKLNEVARAVDRRGKTWIAPVRLATGRRALRACITSFRTEERDLDVLMQELALAGL